MLDYTIGTFVDWSDARCSELELLQDSAVLFAAAGLMSRGAGADWSVLSLHNVMACFCKASVIQCLHACCLAGRLCLDT